MPGHPFPPYRSVCSFDWASPRLSTRPPPTPALDSSALACDSDSTAGEQIYSEHNLYSQVEPASETDFNETFVDTNFGHYHHQGSQLQHQYHQNNPCTISALQPSHHYAHYSVHPPTTPYDLQEYCNGQPDPFQAHDTYKTTWSSSIPSAFVGPSIPIPALGSNIDPSLENQYTQAASQVNRDSLGWKSLPLAQDDQRRAYLDVQDTLPNTDGMQSYYAQPPEDLVSAGIETTKNEPTPQPKGKRKTMASPGKDASAKPPKKSRNSQNAKFVAGTLHQDVASEKPKPALVGQVAPPGWAKLDGIRGPSPPLKPCGTYFSSYEEAVAAMVGPGWMPPADDVVPQANEELQPYMRRLYDAMRDMTQFRDKIGNASLQKRWLDLDYKTTGQYSNVLTNPFYMPHILECLAWKILHMVQKLHIHGPGSIGNLEPLILEASFEDAHLTFDERINLFVDICRFRKSRVQAMFEGGTLERYVLTPSSLLTGSDTNAIANSRRQSVLVEGREPWAAKNSDKVPKKSARRYLILPNEKTKSKTVVQGNTVALTDGEAKYEDETTLSEADRSADAQYHDEDFAVEDRMLDKDLGFDNGESDAFPNETRPGSQHLDVSHDETGAQRGDSSRAPFEQINSSAEICCQSPHPETDGLDSFKTSLKSWPRYPSARNGAQIARTLHSKRKVILPLENDDMLLQSSTKRKRDHRDDAQREEGVELIVAGKRSRKD